MARETHQIVSAGEQAGERPQRQSQRRPPPDPVPEPEPEIALTYNPNKKIIVGGFPARDVSVDEAKSYPEGVIDTALGCGAYGKGPHYDKLGRKED